ncbi:MAG TPA: hypothetical protein VN673_17580 [Clostridia bacterium]|nr:hypothetical protein [Clostridia bacterium]
MDDEVSNDQPADEPFFDPTVTTGLFLNWRTPRYGRANPERMNNPVWEWLIRSRLSAYQANEKLGGPSALRAGPGWCFDRYGQSTNELPDGCKVMIAGEHEDYYDPDFYIYNDIVVLHPDGKIDILGYVAEVFPPTDFHSATLVGNRIIIVGNLGYPEQRKPGTTPVIVLDLSNFSIAPVKTCGRSPGWIHDHEAVMEDGGTSILIRHGKLDPGGEEPTLVENIDDWRLNLSDWRWERVTERRWQRYEIVRKDRKPNHLWQIQQAIWSRSVGWKQDLDRQMAELTEELGISPNLDAASKLFCPSIPHEQIPGKDEEYNITRIKVEGVLIRYVADMHSIQLTVEGELDPNIVKSLASELGEKLSVLENTSIQVRPRE